MRDLVIDGHDYAIKARAKESIEHYVRRMKLIPPEAVVLYSMPLSDGLHIIVRYGFRKKKGG